ncbi:MAG: prepilin peptidase [Proteobacteria bacterium]|nr:prepilin peptidase [Pseudomonadota bacterium]
MYWILYIQSTAAFLLCGVAAWTDFRTGRIPNRLNLVGLGVGLVAALVSGGARGLLIALVGVLVTALVPLLLFRFDAMGGGDVKLFAALGALLGPAAGLEVEMLAFMLGAVQGMIVWLKNGQLRKGLGLVIGLVVPSVFRMRSADAGAIAVKATEIRFGPAIFLATTALVYSRIFG